MTTKSLIRVGLLALTLAALGACAPTYRSHGYIPPEDDLAEIVVGVDTKATVEDVVGTPSSAGLRNDEGFFYVRSRVRTFGPTRPREIERQVLAISFDESDVVQNIERFGLEDGRVVALERRVTDNGITNLGFLRQLLGNIGNFDPGQFLGGEG